MKDTPTDVRQTLKLETIPAIELAGDFKKSSALASVGEDDLRSLGDVLVIRVDRDMDLFEAAGVRRGFWVLLEGELRVLKREDDGSITPFGNVTAGDTFGEVPLLVGKEPKSMIATVLEPSRVAYLKEDTFWQLMFCCPQVRDAVLGNMARRLQLYQSQALHREKLISLGTLAAGLMHELNNPGAAARRAASQLRENLTGLQRISLRMCSGERKTEGQMACLRSLQEHALEPEKQVALNSLEQSDAEEKLAEWLEDQGIENAWKLAPTLTAIGLDEASLRCAEQEFQGSALSDPLNWVAALVSSVQLVGTIEESISRVTDLVKAVKKYGYEDKAERHEVDVHDGIHSTLVILGHKFREKELSVVKQFGSGLRPISTCGRGLNQVWTNLLDNAIDAAPYKGVITIRTWAEGTHLCVSIRDNGPGIPPENKVHIFEPFYTTKPVGEGTGLGLDIVHRIVVGQFGGHIQVNSVPGDTEFVVMLPLDELPAAPCLT
ncbi:MAG TPA: ATP-binding protein [Acidobacteriaceae bacterium]|nr:ATP-binding protein [Acidobacteriaceae bacterium]